VGLLPLCGRGTYVIAWLLLSVSTLALFVRGATANQRARPVRLVVSSPPSHRLCAAPGIRVSLCERDLTAGRTTNILRLLAKQTPPPTPADGALAPAVIKEHFQSGPTRGRGGGADRGRPLVARAA